MKNNTKGLLVSTLLIGGSLFFIKKNQEQKRDSTKEINELAELETDWLEKKEQVSQSVQQLKKMSENYLQPFLAETNQIMTNFNFQIEPRIKQISKQTNKIADNFTKRN